MKTLYCIPVKLCFVILISGTLVINSCEKDRVPLSFKTLSSGTFKGVLEFPGGLAEKPVTDPLLKYLSGITKGVNDFEGILVEGPGFQNFYNAGGIQGMNNPRIKRLTENSIDGGFELNEIAQIDLNAFFEDMDSYGYYPEGVRKRDSIIIGQLIGDTLWRAKGLLLDGLILTDGTILVSSNSSDKLFTVGDNVVSTFQNPGLKGIIDMIEGSDSRIYATRIDPEGSFVKEVISIKNQNIKHEFELPQGLFDLGNEAPYIERLKIAENSTLGKEKSGTIFYISDLLKKTIYKVDDKYNIEIFSDNLNYPSSLVVDSYGYVFYTTTPVISFSSWSPRLVSSTKICSINPETGMPKEIFSFEENLSDYYADGSIWWSSSTGSLFQISGSDYGNSNAIPSGYNVTTILRERGDTLDFLVTNSHKGTLNYVSIVREGGK